MIAMIALLQLIFTRIIVIGKMEESDFDLGPF